MKLFRKKKYQRLDNMVQTCGCKVRKIIVSRMGFY